MHPYKEIFDRVHSTLKKNSTLSEKEFDGIIDEHKEYENRDYSDCYYFDKLRIIPFFSGFDAEIVKGRKVTIENHFPNYLIVLNYGENDIERIIQDKKMIRNRKKIESCIENAKIFKKIVEENGSFQRYVDSFEIKENEKDSFENLMLFKEDIDYKFKFLGQITSYHFMTDIGLSVLKPDRVIQRIFCRLGFIETHKNQQLLKTVAQGKKMSEATDYPIRAVDYVLWSFGQKGKNLKLGIDKGICLEKNPRCDICEVKEFCKYYRNNF